MGRHKEIDKHDGIGIDPDALTTDPDVRVRQLNLVMYSARCAAEKAGAAYRAAVQRMHAAEISFARAVNERRREQVYLGVQQLRAARKADKSRWTFEVTPPDAASATTVLRSPPV